MRIVLGASLSLEADRNKAAISLSFPDSDIVDNLTP
jgi:hypothetical protein